MNFTNYLSLPKYRWVWHLLFWMAYWVFYGIFYGSFDDNYKGAFTEVLVTLPMKMVTTYFVLYYLMPQYLLSKKYIEFVGVLLTSSILFGLAQRIILYYGLPILYAYEYKVIGVLLSPLKVVKGMISMYSVAAIALAIKLLKLSYEDERAKQQLKSEKLEAELKFLKSQIHPHFLFNTLNNLYALTLKNSHKAPEVVLKLSNLLDYMLYECNVPTIPLSKEIELVNNYISLEKLRYGDRLDVSFNFSANALKAAIAPMLILPFVENGFKHGVSPSLEKNWLYIDLTLQNGQLTLKVENSKIEYHNTVDNNKDYHQGIGLKNIKKRLELLYKHEYDLQIIEEEDTFLVILKLQLNLTNNLTESFPTMNTKLINQ